MSRYPGAVWRPVPYTGLHPRQPARAMLLHTNGGGAQLFGWWSQLATGNDPQTRHVGAQYQVFADGRVECYVDPDMVVYHAFGASEWAFGVETEDDGDPSRPWTPAQIDSIARIGHFHGVPARILTGTGPSDGVGYHQQQPAWNQSGHDCPGLVRRRQIPQVLTALAALNSTPPRPTPPSADRWLGLHNPPMVDLPGHHDVSDVQHALAIALVFNPEHIDGVYGPETAAAVNAFQQNEGIDERGVGPLTWAALRKVVHGG